MCVFIDKEVLGENTVISRVGSFFSQNFNILLFSTSVSITGDKVSTPLGHFSLKYTILSSYPKISTGVRWVSADHR